MTCSVFRRFLPSWAPVLAAVVLWAPPALAAKGVLVTTTQVRAELLVHAPQGLQAGQPFWLGLKIDHQPHWHTYWKNPGDSGLPTSLNWQLPAGVKASEIEWPTPSRLPIGPLMNYGYEGTLMLPVAVTLPAGWQGEQLDVKLQAQWLVCKDVCIPEEGEFTLSIPAKSATAGHATLFADSRAKQPQAQPGVSGNAAVQGAELVVKLIGLPGDWQGQTLTLFPEFTGVINNAAKQQAQWEGNSWTGRIALDPQRSESPQRMAMVWTRPGAAAGLRVELPVTTPWPTVAQAPSAAALPPIVASNPAAETAVNAGAAGWLSALLLALVGGALLNLMPCVFPVLSLKVLGFAGLAHNRPARVAAGLAYTAGVVLSFVALAGLMLALRAGGEQVGWGFQLQSPAVVAVLAALFTLIGLNLAGLFEFGSVLPSGIASAQARLPLLDSALTGVLAVAVASPCTAPFMGAALGFALGLPAWQALAVFAALGLGMALPYLLASAWPALARALPRPGAWMAHFKTLMSFPMFATVVWLVWVLGYQTGVDGAAALLLVLVALAFLAWALGSGTLGTQGRRGFGAVALATFAAATVWAWPLLREGSGGAASPTASTASPTKDGWQPWSREAVQQALASGQPVFVDFTAAWCVTCQVNKRTTLTQAAVQEDFAARKVLLLRADWTRKDAEISAELNRLQRSGVPVYALYAPGGAAPRLLPELLTVATVQAALAELPQAR